ncbi:hypothetical protein GCM10023156_29750 [Novipirellula rosea]|uniref:Uncharacterized protein n=1 Tax=Novipirellula rosea TaxID=1031540 RepID=A0ABP8MT70_9BACT
MANASAGVRSAKIRAGTTSEQAIGYVEVASPDVPSGRWVCGAFLGHALIPMATTYRHEHG